MLHKLRIVLRKSKYTFLFYKIRNKPFICSLFSVRFVYMIQSQSAQSRHLTTKHKNSAEKIAT